MCTHKSYFKEYENSVLQCPMVHNISTYQAPRYSWFLQLAFKLNEPQQSL